jgi:hypothetical protein
MKHNILDKQTNTVAGYAVVTDNGKLGINLFLNDGSESYQGLFDTFISWVLNGDYTMVVNVTPSVLSDFVVQTDTSDVNIIINPDDYNINIDLDLDGMNMDDLVPIQSSVVGRKDSDFNIVGTVTGRVYNGTNDSDMTDTCDEADAARAHAVECFRERIIEHIDKYPTAAKKVFDSNYHTSSDIGRLEKRLSKLMGLSTKVISDIELPPVNLHSSEFGSERCNSLHNYQELAVSKKNKPNKLSTLSKSVKAGNARALDSKVITSPIQTPLSKTYKFICFGTDGPDSKRVRAYLIFHKSYIHREVAEALGVHCVSAGFVTQDEDDFSIIAHGRSESLCRQVGFEDEELLNEEDFISYESDFNYFKQKVYASSSIDPSLIDNPIWCKPITNTGLSPKFSTNPILF